MVRKKKKSRNKCPLRATRLMSVITFTWKAVEFNTLWFCARAIWKCEGGGVGRRDPRMGCAMQTPYRVKSLGPCSTSSLNTIWRHTVYTDNTFIARLPPWVEEAEASTKTPRCSEARTPTRRPRETILNCVHRPQSHFTRLLERCVM